MAVDSALDQAVSSLLDKWLCDDPPNAVAISWTDGLDGEEEVRFRNLVPFDFPCDATREMPTIASAMKVINGNKRDQMDVRGKRRVKLVPTAHARGVFATCRRGSAKGYVAQSVVLSLSGGRLLIVSTLKTVQRDSMLTVMVAMRFLAALLPTEDYAKVVADYNLALFSESEIFEAGCVQICSLDDALPLITARHRLSADEMPDLSKEAAVQLSKLDFPFGCFRLGKLRMMLHMSDGETKSAAFLLPSRRGLMVETRVVRDNYLVFYAQSAGEAYRRTSDAIEHFKHFFSYCLAGDGSAAAGSEEDTDERVDQAWLWGCVPHEMSPCMAPVRAPWSVRGVKTVAVGEGHALLLTVIGNVLAYGRGAHGVLGLGNLDDISSPQPVPELQHVGVVAIAAGSSHSVALTSSGDVFTWGRRSSGRLGLPAVDGDPPQLVPAKVYELAAMQVTKIAAGTAFTVAVTSTGLAYSWGDNTLRQLGHDRMGRHELGPGGMGKHELLPRVIESGGVAVTSADEPPRAVVRFTDVACGGSHLLLLADKSEEEGDDGSDGGRVYGAGNNVRCQLTATYYSEGFSALQALPVFDAVMLAAGDSHSVVLRSNGEVSVWGENRQGQCQPDNREAAGGCTRDPVSWPLAEMIPALGDEQEGDHDVVSIGAGRAHTMVLLRGGRIFCCGLGTRGQLGTGHASERRDTFVEVEALRGHGIAHMATSGDFCVALRGFHRSRLGEQLRMLMPASVRSYGMRARTEEVGEGKEAMEMLEEEEGKVEAVDEEEVVASADFDVVCAVDGSVVQVHAFIMHARVLRFTAEERGDMPTSLMIDAPPAMIRALLQWCYSDSLPRALDDDVVSALLAFADKMKMVALRLRMAEFVAVDGASELRLREQQLRLEDDMAALVCSSCYADKYFVVEGRDVAAHKQLLLRGGDYFRTMMTGHFGEASAERIALADVSFGAFRAVLHYLYTSELLLLADKEADAGDEDTEEVTEDGTAAALDEKGEEGKEAVTAAEDGGEEDDEGDEEDEEDVMLAVEVLHYASLHALPGLAALAESRLLKVVDSSNALGAYQLADMYGAEQLKSACWAIMVRYTATVFAADEESTAAMSEETAAALAEATGYRVLRTESGGWRLKE